MKYGILPLLTREYVLKRVSEMEIFSRYTNITENHISDLANSGDLICNPMRLDKTPTLGFKYSKNGVRLRMKDFAGYFHGDCFDLVGMLIRENPSSKSGFLSILDYLSQDFKLHKYENSDKIKAINLNNINTVEKVKRKRLNIQYQKRAWNKFDAKYWTKFNITRKILKKFNVYPCMYIWVEGELRYEYNVNNPTYCYDYFDDETELKIYYPFRKKFRFISNTSMLQGINIITNDDFGVITKSYKDVMTLDSFSIQAVAPSSETHLISKENVDILNTNWSYLFGLMDLDRTGKMMSKKLKELYNIPPLSVQYDAELNKLNHTAKDISDLVKEKGVKYTENLVEETILFYGEKHGMIF